MNLKRKVFNQCILPTLTYECQTWDTDERYKDGILPTENRKKNVMLGKKFIDKEPNLEIRERTKINGILEEITKLKWKWAGYVAHMRDNRWTVRCTEWRVRDGKRSKGRPKRRWRDDIQQ